MSAFLLTAMLTRISTKQLLRARSVLQTSVRKQSVRRKNKDYVLTDGSVCPQKLLEIVKISIMFKT